MAKLKTELSAAQKQVFTLEDSEKLLRERLADEKHRSLTLEKMASIQKQKVESVVEYLHHDGQMLKKSYSFKNFVSDPTGCSD